MIQGISKFYKEEIASTITEGNSQRTTKTIIPLTRTNFIVGSGLASIFLIKKIAYSALLFVENIFTAFQNLKLRNSLSHNVQQIPTYLGAVLLGYVGIIIPETINEKAFGIPANGLIQNL
jgi:hypothetical protein